MAVLTVTINTPSPAFASKTSEVAWLHGALLTAAMELRRDGGNRTSGTIVGSIPSGPTATLGTWTYTPTATNS